MTEKKQKKISLVIAPFCFLACHWFTSFGLCYLNWLISLVRTRIVFSEYHNFASCHLFYHIFSSFIRGGILVDLGIGKISDLVYTVIFRSMAMIAGIGVRSRIGTRWQDQRTKESRASHTIGSFRTNYVDSKEHTTNSKFDWSIDEK